MKMDSSSRVLVVNVSALGDLICSLGLIRSLHKASGQMALLVSESYRDLFMDEPFEMITLSEALQRSFDHVIDVTSSGQTRRWMANFRSPHKLGRADGFWRRLKARSAYHTVLKKVAAHQHVRDHDPIFQYFGLSPVERPFLHRSQKPSCLLPQLEKFIGSTQHKVALHIFSKDPLRTLPQAVVNILIEELEKKNCVLFLVGEAPEIEAFAAKQSLQNLLYAPLNIAQLKYLLSYSDFFVGGDSGPLHLAASLGIRSFGIFGPTLARQGGPLGSHIQFLELDFDCRPCDTKRRCPYNQRCLETMTRGQIHSSLQRLWSMPLAPNAQSQ